MSESAWGAELDLDALVEWRTRELDARLRWVVDYLWDLLGVPAPPRAEIDAILAPLSTLETGAEQARNGLNRGKV